MNGRASGRVLFTGRTRLFTSDFTAKFDMATLDFSSPGSPFWRRLAFDLLKRPPSRHARACLSSARSGGDVQRSI